MIQFNTSASEYLRINEELIPVNKEGMIYLINLIKAMQKDYDYLLGDIRSMENEVKRMKYRAGEDPFKSDYFILDKDGE
jgi:hypothetical protein